MIRALQLLLTLTAALVCAVAMASCQTSPPRAPDPFDAMLGEAAAAMFRDAPMMPNSLK